MEKKFYEAPEAEVIELMLESHILTISVDTEDPGVLPGEASTDDLG